MSLDAFPVFTVSTALASESDRDNSIDGIDTTFVKSGTFASASGGAAATNLYRLDTTSSAAADGVNVIAPLTGPGRWLLYVSGAGGVVVQAAANLAALAAITVSGLSDGALAFVATVKDYYGYEPGSTAPADGITVVAPASGGGRWIRRMIADTDWQLQATWYIDSVSGNDEGDGLTPATALKHHAELERRWGNAATLQQDTTVRILADLDATVDAQPRVVLTLARGKLLRYLGTPTEIDSGTLTGATASDPATNFQQTVTDAAQDFSGHIQKRIRLTSGAASGAVSWIAAIVGANDTARVGDFIRTTTALGSQTTLSVAPAGTEDYSIETLPNVNALYHEVRRDTNAYSGSDWALVLEDIRITADTYTFLDGGSRPNVVNSFLATTFIYGSGSTLLVSGCGGTVRVVRRCTLEIAGSVFYEGMTVGVGALLGLGAVTGPASATLWQSAAVSPALSVSFGGYISSFIKGRIAAFCAKAGGIGVRVAGSNSAINGAENLYGVSTTSGLFMGRSARVVWAGATNKPTITGGSNEINFNALAAWTWADTPNAIIDGGGFIDASATPPHDYFYQGSGTLVAGQAIIGAGGDGARIQLRAGSVVLITKQVGAGATRGVLEVAARTNGDFGVANFTVQALDATGALVTDDVSTFDWLVSI